MMFWFTAVFFADPGIITLSFLGIGVSFNSSPTCFSLAKAFFSRYCILLSVTLNILAHSFIVYRYPSPRPVLRFRTALSEKLRTPRLLSTLSQSSLSSKAIYLPMVSPPYAVFPRAFPVGPTLVYRMAPTCLLAQMSQLCRYRGLWEPQRSLNRSQGHPFAFEH